MTDEEVWRLAREALEALHLCTTVGIDAYDMPVIRCPPTPPFFPVHAIDNQVISIPQDVCTGFEDLIERAVMPASDSMCAAAGVPDVIVHVVCVGDWQDVCTAFEDFVERVVMPASDGVCAAADVTEDVVHTVSVADRQDVCTAFEDFVERVVMPASDGVCAAADVTEDVVHTVSVADGQDVFTGVDNFNFTAPATPPSGNGTREHAGAADHVRNATSTAADVQVATVQHNVTAAVASGSQPQEPEAPVLHMLTDSGGAANSSCTDVPATQQQDGTSLSGQDTAHSTALVPAMQQQDGEALHAAGAGRSSLSSDVGALEDGHGESQADAEADSVSVLGKESSEQPVEDQQQALEEEEEEEANGRGGEATPSVPHLPVTSDQSEVQPNDAGAEREPGQDLELVAATGGDGEVELGAGRLAQVATLQQNVSAVIASGSQTPETTVLHVSTDSGVVANSSCTDVPVAQQEGTVPLTTSYSNTTRSTPVRATQHQDGEALHAAGALPSGAGPVEARHGERSADAEADGVGMLCEACSEQPVADAQEALQEEEIKGKLGEANALGDGATPSVLSQSTASGDVDAQHNDAGSVQERGGPERTASDGGDDAVQLGAVDLAEVTTALRAPSAAIAAGSQPQQPETTGLHVSAYSGGAANSSCTDAPGTQQQEGTDTLSSPISNTMRSTAPIPATQHQDGEALRAAGADRSLLTTGTGAVKAAHREGQADAEAGGVPALPEGLLGLVIFVILGSVLFGALVYKLLLDVCIEHEETIATVVMIAAMLALIAAAAAVLLAAFVMLVACVHRVWCRLRQTALQSLRCGSKRAALRGTPCEHRNTPGWAAWVPPPLLQDQECPTAVTAAFGPPEAHPLLCFTKSDMELGGHVSVKVSGALRRELLRAAQQIAAAAATGPEENADLPPYAPACG
eukprot:TRINITY_DN5737_c0_g1_i1.p1 TRINITY_DN5737_c0_g1~~TRINITY_DN5737_c0_g1_i1.p1  ORF type:complete len:920 (-),score=247.40 TRINITY_DN5737_c0_g1_i1:370-3129(-)